jgi:type VI secretion system FHA domain protein
VLELVSPQSQAVASAPRFVVGYEPVLIGRDASCDWVFNDQYVSGRHALIRFVNGLFFVEAIGRNPTAIDDPAQVVPRGKSQPLREGCRLFIDVHELNVMLEERDALAPGPQRPVEAREAAAPPMPRGFDRADVAVRGFDMGPDGSAGKDASDVIGLMGDSAPRRHQRKRASHEEDSDFLSNAFEPAKVESDGPHEGSPGVIPEDPEWWKQGASGGSKEKAAPGPRPSQPVPASRTGTDSGDLAQLLRGAGIDPAILELSPEVPRHLGEILRIVVEGTMDVLRARAEIKEQFRLAGTRVQRKDNNPLKFSADVNDAMHNLLVKRSEAYLPPVEAFETAFEEIRRHQLAMLQGLRVAFDQLVRRLDPKKLASDVDQQGKSGILIGNPRARYWDAYESLMKDLAKAPDDRFRQLFGDAFGRAYEQQLAQLASARRRSPRESKP